MNSRPFFLLITEAQSDDGSGPDVLSVPQDSVIGLCRPIPVFPNHKQTQNAATTFTRIAPKPPERHFAMVNTVADLGSLETPLSVPPPKKPRKAHFCPVCNKKFHSTTKLRNHLTVHSDERPYSCQVCSKAFKRPQQVKNHMTVHINEHFVKREAVHQQENTVAASATRLIVIPAPKVDVAALKPLATTETKAPASKSGTGIERVINGWLYCKICHKGYPGRSKLERHLQSHDQPVDTPTKIKQEKTQSVPEESLLKVHACTICHKVFPIKTKLDLHLTTHSNERPFTCRVCLKSFKILQQLKTHAKIHMGEFKCEHCDLKFRTQRLLTIHGDLHSNVELIFCDVCGKRFSNEKSRKNHEYAAHKSVYSCKHCYEKFKSSIDYRKHVKEVHKTVETEKSHVCLECGLSFQFNCQLKYHMVVHEKDTNNKYMCDTCGVILTTQKSLKDHLLRHTGIKPFQCEICGKGFINRAKLKFHSRTHTGEKPYSCLVCDKKFTQRTTLVIHVRNHTGEKPYTCDLCQQAFASRGMMNNHKRSKHKIDSSR